MGCRRAPNLLLSSFLVFTATFHVAFSVDDHSDDGSISIDCGSVEENKDTVTQRLYHTDQGYVDTGNNTNIPDGISENLPAQLRNSRVFAEGIRNCYVLRLKQGGHSRYLIRALFRYGNYDGKSLTPEFDLYIGINKWKTVIASDPEPDNYVYHEIIYDFPMNTESVDVCLVNIDRGIPFISALELRPMNSSIYPADPGTALSTAYRYDFGYRPGNLLDVTTHSNVTLGPTTNGNILQSTRYKEDPYDRIWSQYDDDIDSDSSRYFYITVDAHIDDSEYSLPQQVWKTATEPRLIIDCIDVEFNTTNQINTTANYNIYFHFAEFVLSTWTREISIYLKIPDGGYLKQKPIELEYLKGLTQPYPIYDVNVNEVIQLRICGTNRVYINSVAILNAIELYEQVLLSNNWTNPEDVNAMNIIKRTYGVQRNWQGDPCLPAHFSWSGLTCNNNEIPNVTAVNLTSSNLSGPISDLFSSLRSLELLDLSNNNLNGTIPESLANLDRLRVLNLSGNQLQGPIPEALKQKNNTGNLTMIYDERSPIPPSSRGKNVAIAPTTAAAVAVTLVIAVAIAIAILWWKRKQKRRGITSTEIMVPQSREADSGNSRLPKALQSKNPEFSYSQLLRITNNFQTVIGGGGFGKVYLGALEDGTRVAVKLLSDNSVQGRKEYYYEALILSKVHHANLVSLIGYCNDGKNMMLVYEYMPNGNLRQHLSENSTIALDWRRRLDIAIHAAQGLDYLHNGCKPPIIHRDVKTSNILLDENWHAKIGDFGLSRNSAIEGKAHTTAVAGTFAYMDPEYLSTRKMNKKSDVYSFGVVLLELITGKAAMIKGYENLHVIHWTRSLVENGDIQSIMDSRLYGNFKPTVAWKAVEIAMSCVSPLSIQRPEISQVFVELKECLAIETAPDKSEGSLTMSSIEIDTSMFPYAR